MTKRDSLVQKIKHFGLGGLTSATVLLFVQAKSTDSYFEMSKNLEIFTDIFKELNTYYVDPIEPGKLTKAGIDAMLDDLDPYTNYITEADIEDYEFTTTGRYSGIGASLRKRDNDIYISDVYENSPAQKAGLHPGDKLISIDGNPTESKSVDEVSMMLKGSTGTQLNIKVKDVFTNTEVERMVTRGEVEVASVQFAGLIGPDKDIAYVKLNQFTKDCAKQVRSALDSLKRAKPELRGVMLDLRGNPGGLLDEAVDVCNIFVDRGQLIVTTKGKDREWDKDFNTQGAPWDTKIPLVVLVNHSSASASEIVAGTMQDLDRGLIVGEKSYGKGLVQTTRSLSFNARLKLTTAKYYTPSGRCIQAIDYSHRNAQGIASKIPDSLQQTFKTKNGRKVLSGGGVSPDIVVKEEPLSTLSVTLYTKNYFFDYATQYARQHKSIGTPEAFALSIKDFNDFVTWLGNKDYSYKTKTEELLDSLTASAKREEYFNAAKNEISLLKAKFTHDKKQDLLKHQKEITEILESEIVSRYFYQRGRVEQGIKNDEGIARGIELIRKPTEAQALLQTK